MNAIIFDLQLQERIPRRGGIFHAGRIQVKALTFLDHRLAVLQSWRAYDEQRIASEAVPVRDDLDVKDLTLVGLKLEVANPAMLGEAALHNTRRSQFQRFLGVCILDDRQSIRRHCRCSSQSPIPASSDRLVIQRKPIGEVVATSIEQVMKLQQIVSFVGCREINRCVLSALRQSLACDIVQAE